MTRVVQNLVMPGDVAYDVGADVGYFALLFARLVGPQGKVYAFEASVRAAEYLKRTILENSLRNVSVVPATVGAIAQEEELALDDFVFSQGHPPPRVVKIDVEGWEAKVFAGMSRLLAEFRPVFVLELHGPQPGAALWSSLHEHEYRIQRITATGLTSVTRDDFQYRHFLATSLQ